jgi:hypothetical protein
VTTNTEIQGTREEGIELFKAAIAFAPAIAEP